MKEKEDLKPVFPKGYEDLEVSLQNLQDQLSAIDREIESLTEEQGPRLTFEPPGYTSRYGNIRDREGERLKGEQAKLKDTFRKTVDDKLELSDPKTATTVKGIVDYQLSDNPYKNLSDAKAD